MEARYPNQVWTLEVPIDPILTTTPEGVAQLVEAFHAAHRETFAVADVNAPIEIESWHARAHCQLTEPQNPVMEQGHTQPRERRVYIPHKGWRTATVWRLPDVPIDRQVAGPAVVETATTSVLIEEGAQFSRRSSGTLHVVPEALAQRTAPSDGSTGKVQ